MTVSKYVAVRGHVLVGEEGIRDFLLALSTVFCERVSEPWLLDKIVASS